MLLSSVEEKTPFYEVTKVIFEKKKRTLKENYILKKLLG